MPDFDEQHTPPRPGPEKFVRRVRAREKLTVTCISRTWWGIWIHWDGKRSHPHEKAQGKCQGCKRGWPKRWKAYLHVYNSSNHAQEFLELTPIAVEALQSETAPSNNMRGVRFTIERGAGDKARMRIALLSHHESIPGNRPLPHEEDPKPTLLALWGLGQTSFGDENEGPALAGQVS